MIDLLNEFSEAFRSKTPYDDLRELALRYLDSPISEIEVRWHPLGFIDLPLGQGSSLTKMSLHVWHRQYSRPQSPQQICHSHGWELLSVVLSGNLENIIFNVYDDLAGKGRLYEVAYSGSTSEATATQRRVSARILRTEAYSSRDSYRLPADQFHWTEPSCPLLVTVMYSSLANRITPRVVWPWSEEIIYRYKRAECTDDNKRSILSDVVDAIRIG